MNNTKYIELFPKKEFAFTNETGNAQITVYPIFPGVEVAYISVHMDYFDFKETETERYDHYAGFHYCKEGRIEQAVDGEFFCLTPGDCSVVVQDRRIKNFRLPTKHYCGISIGIDTDITSDPFSEFLGNRSVIPRNVVQRICGENHLTILRSNATVGHFFSDFYAVGEEQRLDYLKIKVLELLYVLSNMELSDSLRMENTAPRSQVDLVRNVAEYISKNINKRISIKDLTVKFGVSDTYLQNSFKTVYGMPVISFIRIQKMQCAAQILIHTERSVEDVANEFGYGNESKFSNAFKKIMGELPSQYRKEHLKITIL